MKTLIDQSGLVAESDYLSLSSTLVVKQGYLHDKITGAKHKLHQKAINSISLLEQPIPFELWQHLNRRFKLEDDNVLQILLFLNSIGGLEIGRSLSGHRRILYKQFKTLIHGQAPIVQARRWRTSLVNIGHAVLLAMQPVVLATAFTAILADSINVDRTLIAVMAINFLIIIWFSTVLHEQTHNFILSKRTKRRVLLRRGLRVGILHRRLSHKTELISALIGPLVGALASLISCLILGLIFGQSGRLLVIGSLIAGFQLVSLLPAYGDGRIVWNNLKGIA